MGCISIVFIGLGGGGGGGLQGIRLVDRSPDSPTLVEVYLYGEWGGVHFLNWNLNAARVVCRQLGYQTATAVLVMPVSKEQYGLIWVVKFQCSGNETSLSECKQVPIEQRDCFIWDNAGVACGGEELFTVSDD